MRSNRLNIVWLILAVPVLWCMNGCASHPSSTQSPAVSKTKSQWIEETLHRLTLEEKIGQMIMSRSYGYYFSEGSDEYHRLQHLVQEHKFGGLIFFQGDVLESATLINSLQQMADVPLLVAADFEWGGAMRIRRMTRFPEAMALGAARDSMLVYEIGKAIGEESRAIGVQQVFAPVADVNINPDNPVINTRSFGENPQLVAALSTAYVNGLQSGGALATAKHFPGHGDTQIDSHIELPMVDASRIRLDTVELVPYRAMFKAHLGSVMVAHLVVPSIENNRALPSTLSPKIINGLLKNEMGFTGLVVTDAMDMGALVNGFGSDSSAVRAVEAGVDVLLILPDEDGAVEAITHAVQSGRIVEERINESVRKILNAKWDLGLAQNRLIDLERIRDVVATPRHLALAKQAARKSITVLKNDSLLPFERNGRKRILSIVVADVENYRTEINRTNTQWPNEAVGEYLTVQLKKRYTNIESFRLDPAANQLDVDSLMKKTNNADLLLISVFSKSRSGSGKFGLPPAIVASVKNLLGLGKPTVLVSMGSPYVLSSFPNASAYVCAYSDCEVSTEAVAEALFGEIPATGKLPVTVPGMFSFGEGLELDQNILRRDAPEIAGFIRDSLNILNDILTDAIQDSAFPGAQLSVVKDGAVVLNRSYGGLDYSGLTALADNTTMYDIASMTKVIATTPAIMKLYDDSLLQLDDPVVKYIPEFANHGKERITIRNLLMHNGGLPAFKQLFLTCASPQQVLDSVYQTEMIYPTGDSTVYSDFDFILLGKIVEKVSGATLDRFVDSVFFKPLGMTRTMFKPPESLWDNIAPTEYDSVFRKKLIRGVVHDENAYALGGVSGHAGVFSTSYDLAIFMQMIMNGGSYGGRHYLKSETIKLFTAKQSSKSTRGLGWDTKTMNGYSSAGSFFGEKTFGHTGFTGTSVWADPEKKIFVILLTNRVHPTRLNSKIGKVRPLVHDAVMRALR